MAALIWLDIRIGYTSKSVLNYGLGQVEILKVG